jgi:hypothetical protein
MHVKEPDILLLPFLLPCFCSARFRYCCLRFSAMRASASRAC